MRPRAYGIVRLDIAPHGSDAYVDDIRALAAERGWDLRGVFLERSDESFPLLLASLGLSGFAAVVVPSIAHVSGWLDLLRQSADVWTLDPPCRWPLETADRRVG